jgi:hypothetical protein
MLRQPYCVVGGEQRAPVREDGYRRDSWAAATRVRQPILPSGPFTPP